MDQIAQWSDSQVSKLVKSLRVYYLHDFKDAETSHTEDRLMDQEAVSQ